MFGGALLRKASASQRIMNRFGAIMIVFSFCIVAFFGFTNLSDYMLYKMENLVVETDLPERPAGIIVLGGGLNSRITRLRNIKYAISDAGERLIVGLELSNRFPDIPLIYSGGPPAGEFDREPETVVAQNIAQALYNDKKIIVAEDRSRNTWENAMFAKELLKPKPGAKWIIVTSAFHAARASAIFDRVGFDFVLYPTDYRAEFDGSFRFNGDALSQFEKLDLVLKELAGIIAYTLMGRIDWPF